MSWAEHSHDNEEHQLYLDKQSKKKKMSKTKTLAQWTKEVETLLMKDYGITTGDCTDDEQLEVEFKDGTSPQDFVEFIADKRDLDKLNKGFYA